VPVLAVSLVSVMAVEKPVHAARLTLIVKTPVTKVVSVVLLLKDVFSHQQH
jgi:hypothetical protein